MACTNPLEKMSQHYESLLESGKLSDVVLVAGGKELKVHKVILSTRSPVFAAMFDYDSKEAQENRVEIIDMDVEVLELMVRYIYTGKVGTLDLLATDLLAAADKYQLDCLKSICAQHLMSHISTETASELLLFADMYRVTELTDKCLDYITNDATRVMVSTGWKKLELRTDLLAKLYESLYLKYTKFIKAHDKKKKIEPMRKKMKIEKGRNCTLEPDHEFQDYLSKYSNVINFNEAMLDVILVAGNKKLKVSKVVLSAHSPVFAAMFAHKKTRQNRVEITNVSVNALKLLLKYIYTDHVERLDWNEAAELLEAADKYQIVHLKSICKHLLASEDITTESASDLLILSDTHQIGVLYSKCLHYISHNKSQVMASEGWKKIVVKVDLLAKICSSLNWNYAEQLLFSPITAESVLYLLFIAEKYKVIELNTKCLDFIIENDSEVRAWDVWKTIQVRAKLLAQLFKHLSLKYTRCIEV